MLLKHNFIVKFKDFNQKYYNKIKRIKQYEIPSPAAARTEFPGMFFHSFSCPSRFPFQQPISASGLMFPPTWWKF